MDDPVNIEKLQAMKIYRMRSVGLLPTLFQYLLSALALGLFLSRLCSSLMLLCSIPKYLFIVCNIIIIVYLAAGDSNNLPKASPATDIYEEYEKRNQREMTKVESTHLVEEIDKEDEEDEVDEEDEEDEGLDGEEMKKKFDDFIAKVIMQRRMEASMHVFHE